MSGLVRSLGRDRDECEEEGKKEGLWMQVGDCNGSCVGVGAC